MSIGISMLMSIISIVYDPTILKDVDKIPSLFLKYLGLRGINYVGDLPQFKLFKEAKKLFGIGNKRIVCKMHVSYYPKKRQILIRITGNRTLRKEVLKLFPIFKNALGPGVKELIVYSEIKN